MNVKSNFINRQIKRGKISPTILEDTERFSNHAAPFPKSLFFWQIYSLTGEDLLRRIITNFYNKVFQDHEFVWFRDAFIETGDIEYHIENQLKFWIDVTGGPVKYHHSLVHLKHSLVKEVMTEEGAQRWLYHMNKVLNTTVYEKDPRVIPCLQEMIEFFMHKYSIEFNFHSRL